MKVLVHDGIGVWLAARRLHSGKFVWPQDAGATLTLSRAQFDAPVLGLPWQRIGEDVAEKLDHRPGVFTVERHVRGKWVCACCEKLVQVPVPAHIIDKGLPTTGLLAQVLVAKCLDHRVPLYRQEAIFERAGPAIARSTLAQWVGECGEQLQPLVDALTAETSWPTSSWHGTRRRCRRCWTGGPSGGRSCRQS
jgi:transposase